VKFRSGLEKEVAKQLKNSKIKFEYEPKEKKLNYTIPVKKARYTPDFYITTRTGKEIIIECKGIWTFVDRYKHLLVRRANPDKDIRFVFSNPKSKIRKGSKMTYADICEGKGRGMFKDQTWKYSKLSIPESWFEE
jgi:hypothetical protein